MSNLIYRDITDSVVEMSGKYWYNGIAYPRIIDLMDQMKGPYIYRYQINKRQSLHTIYCVSLEYHRYDGPAIIDGSYFRYFLHGISLKKDEFLELTTNRNPIEISFELINFVNKHQGLSYHKINVIQHVYETLVFMKVPKHIIDRIEVVNMF